MEFTEMTAKMAGGNGFIAALDQSGGLVDRGRDVRSHPPDARPHHRFAGLHR